MEITIKTSELCQSIQTLKRFVFKHPTVSTPDMSIEVDPDESEISLFTQKFGYLTGIYTTSAEVEGFEEEDPLVFGFPYEQLLNLCKLTDAESIHFKWIDTAWVEITTGKSSFNIVMKENEYPPLMPDEADFEFKGVLDLEKIKHLFFIKKDVGDQRIHPLRIENGYASYTNGFIAMFITIKNIPDVLMEKELLEKIPPGQITISINNKGHQIFKIQKYMFFSYTDNFSSDNPMGLLDENLRKENNFSMPTKVFKEGIKGINNLSPSIGCWLKHNGSSLTVEAVNYNIGEVKIIPLHKGEGDVFEIEVNAKVLLGAAAKFPSGKKDEISIDVNMEKTLLYISAKDGQILFVMKGMKQYPFLQKQIPLEAEAAA